MVPSPMDPLISDLNLGDLWGLVKDLHCSIRHPVRVVFSFILILRRIFYSMLNF